MTQEAGAVTGDLEVATRPLGAGGVEAVVRYAGAEEWYTLEGSPINLENTRDLSPAELRELHGRVVKHLTTPGPILEGNEQPSSLSGFSP